MISKGEKVVNYAILMFFSLVVAIPIFLLLGAALSPFQTGKLAFGDLRWRNFTDAWVQAGFGSHLLVSLTISVVVVLVTLVITPLAAYALGVLEIPGNKLLLTVFIAGIMIPLEGIIVPLYFNLRATPFASTIFALILAHIGLSVSFGVFWMRASFKAIPVEIIESSRLDGAGSLRIFLSMALPLTKPALITLGLLTFMWTWNDYFLAFVLVNDPSQLPVTVALGQFTTKYAVQYNLMSASALMVAAPIVILYIFFQRKFIEGVLSGALKG